jgi:tRNA-binding protein
MQNPCHPERSRGGARVLYFRTMPTFHDFEQLDIRTGTIIAAEPFPEARKPAIKLLIDFGELGVKKSSAQLTVSYSPEMLIGKQIVAVVNFPPRQIGPFVSEVLVLGALGDDGDVILLRPDRDVPNGSKIA